VWCETFNEQGGPMHALCKEAGRHGKGQGGPLNREEHHIVPVNDKHSNGRVCSGRLVRFLIRQTYFSASRLSVTISLRNSWADKPSLLILLHSSLLASSLLQPLLNARLFALLAWFVVFLAL
jgi:hypothetical protein